MLIVDDLPAELEYVNGTILLDNRSLTDAADTDEGTATARRIEILIPTIEPDIVTQVEFQARLSTANTSGNGVVNFGIVSAANAAPVNTSDAVVVVNPIGTVYAGNANGTVRIAGARVMILSGNLDTPLSLVPDTGYAPNAQNINPFASDPNGGFGFALSPAQIGRPETQSAISS